MTTARSEWTFEAKLSGRTIPARIVCDGWMGQNEADVEVRIEIEGETVMRKGRGKVERRFGPLFSSENPISKIAFSSLDGDVKAHDRSLKKAIEAYGSEILKIVVEQRRRAARVENARGRSGSLEVTFEDLQLLKLALANSPQFGERGAEIMLRMTKLSNEMGLAEGR